MINVRKIFGTTKSKPSIDWKHITSEDTLLEAIKSSTEKAILIFKHSTRCSISSMAMSRLENGWDTEEMANISPYYLDLISYRDISNLVADNLNVMHESPQIIIVKDGKSTYHTSHMNISVDAVKSNS
jgi:bacillithiol system protein YtxJ